ncbi:MAG TPA: hypothetical protein VFH40_01220 [Gemmatimonadales bacterium]|nr:hypothetical protein [Gemmatimonadales bacterium]
MTAFATDAVDFDSMTAVVKPVLISHHRQHPLETLVGELDDSAAPLANQVFVIRLRGHGLIPLEPFAELMRPYQAALHQQIECPVHGRQADLFSLLFELATDSLDRDMFLRAEDDLGNDVALAGYRLVVLPEMTAKLVKKSRALCLIEAGHWYR